MIRKQARDLCGRDIGRTVRVHSGGRVYAETLHSVSHDYGHVDLVLGRIRSTVSLDPTETVEVSGSEEAK